MLPINDHNVMVDKAGGVRKLTALTLRELKVHERYQVARLDRLAYVLGDTPITRTKVHCMASDVCIAAISLRPKDELSIICCAASIRRLFCGKSPTPRDPFVIRRKDSARFPYLTREWLMAHSVMCSVKGQ